MTHFSHISSTDLQRCLYSFISLQLWAESTKHGPEGFPFGFYTVAVSRMLSSEQEAAIDITLHLGTATMCGGDIFQLLHSIEVLFRSIVCFLCGTILLVILNNSLFCCFSCPACSVRLASPWSSLALPPLHLFGYLFIALTGEQTHVLSKYTENQGMMNQS